jgi:hypothetical protein
MESTTSFGYLPAVVDNDPIIAAPMPTISVNGFMAIAFKFPQSIPMQKKDVAKKAIIAAEIPWPTKSTSA